MPNKNYQIAKFYTKLFELKDMLHGELLPLGTFIEVEENDAELFASLETAATEIQRHLENYELKIGAEKIMFDKDFWGEPISIYTDADAMDDGILEDIADLKVEFNGRVINRLTSGAAQILETKSLQPETIKNHLSLIARNCAFDGEGFDAWGIFQPDARFGSEKLWLIPNEIGGYTLMLPSEY